MYKAIPVDAPTDDPTKALNGLWAFVMGIGFDPAKVVAAYDTQEAFTLGLAVGSIRARIAESLPADAAKLFKN